MAIVYNLTDETPTLAITVQGWEKMVFFSGEFAGGFVVTDFSPDGDVWFADSNLTFSKKGFETFRAAPSVRYRFRMTRTDPASTPAVAVHVA